MSDTEERSEKPSPHRLRKAREEGDAASSKTLTIAIGFGSTLIMLWLLGDLIRERLSRLLSHAFSSEVSSQMPISLWKTVTPMFWDSLIIVSPFLVTMLVTSTLSGLIQTRGMLSFKRLKIDPSQMNPGVQLKQRFSTMQLFELIKTIIKFILVTFALYWVAKDSIRDLIASMFNPALWNSMALVGDNLFLMAAIACLIYLVMGIIDFIHQYFEFIKRNRMTKSEVKQEQRDLYGDPIINSHLRGQRESMIMGSKTPSNAKPSVIVTNPTHFAVALYYEPGIVELPIVIGKGRDGEALRMRSLALEQGVPIAERPPLARRLYRSLAVGQAIGQDELETVAEVFRWLRQAEQSAQPH